MYTNTHKGSLKNSSVSDTPTIFNVPALSTLELKYVITCLRITLSAYTSGINKMILEWI